MRRTAMAIVAAVMLLAGTADAGTQAKPEISDPAGDAVWLHDGGTNADWADVTRVWLTSTRDTAGAVMGFRVHIETLSDARAPEQDGRLSFGWTLEPAERCGGGLLITRTDPGDARAPGAELWFSCNGDNGSAHYRPVTMTDGGRVLTVEVPLAAFDAGPSRGLYRDGTLLRRLAVDSAVLTPSTGITVDQNSDVRCVRPVSDVSFFCGNLTPFRVGS